MNWYKLIPDTTDSPGRYCSSSHELLGTKPFELKQGKLIESWNDGAWVATEAEYDSEPDDLLLNHIGLPIFSSQIRKELVESSLNQEDIQFLPINVFSTNGILISHHYIVNVVSRVSALDRRNCSLLGEAADRIDPLTGLPEVTRIWKYALLSAHLEGHDIVRLTDFLPPVFVSERFKTLIRKHLFTGFLFQPVQTS